MMPLFSSLFLLVLIASYLVGSIPIGYLVCKFHGFDIRNYGSGNIGATNVARILGIKYFFVILLLDAVKAFVALRCVAPFVSEFELLISALALLAGNSFSIFLLGSGGKGVATMVGIMAALNPVLCFGLLATWLIFLAYFRTVGIASVLTALITPLFAILFVDLYGFLFLAIVSSLIIWKHRINIRTFYMAR